MGGCGMRKCKSKSGPGCTVRFFSFPKDQTYAEKWLRYCTPRTSIKHGRVCSKHFSPSDYKEPTLKQILLQEAPNQKGRTLKPDAIPSLFLDEEEVSEEITVDMNPSESYIMPNNVARGCTDIFKESDGIVSTSLAECDTKPDISGCPKTIIIESENIITIPKSEYEVLKRKSAEHYNLQGTLQKIVDEYENLLKKLNRILTPNQLRSLLKKEKRKTRRVRFEKKKKEGG